MGLISNRNSLIHAVRFSSAILAVLIFPLCGLTRLPLAHTALLFTELSTIAFCISGLVILAWGVAQRVAGLLSDTHRWWVLPATIFTPGLAGMLFLASLMRATHFGPRIGVAVGMACLVVGGAWSLGGVLQWLWDETSIAGVDRVRKVRFSLSRRRPLTRKGDIRG